MSYEEITDKDIEKFKELIEERFGRDVS